MQTLTELALEVVRWERTSLSRGAYRVSGIERLSNAPDITGFSDCSYDEQFIDELTTVKARLGISAGVWVGLVLQAGQVAQVLAFLLD